jgi:hypothetical protein
VGAGQRGAHLPADLPESVRPAIEQVALKTFHEAYIPAMRTTLTVPIVVLAVAVICALFTRRGHNPTGGAEDNADSGTNDLA